jgi:hypothetical protein
LEHHERVFALSAHGGISFPVTDLITIVDVLRTFFDAGTVRDHNASSAFSAPFSPVFSPTDEKPGQRALFLEYILVDRLVTDPFTRHIEMDPSGDLFRTPSKGQLLVHVLSNVAVGNTFPPSALTSASFRSHLCPVGLIPAFFRAVVLDLARYNRWIPFQLASDRSDAFALAASYHNLFAFFLGEDSVRSGGKGGKLHTGGSFGCVFR